MMKLKVLMPTQILVDEQAEKITAEAENGVFTLLPRHIDYAAILVPGLFSFQREEGKQALLATAEGVLVKRGFDVHVSVLNAVRGDNLDTLWETVREDFRKLDERERQARSVIAALESTLVREIAALGTPQV